MGTTTGGLVVGASYGPPKSKSVGAHYLRGDLEQIFPGRRQAGAQRGNGPARRAAAPALASSTRDAEGPGLTS